MPISHIYGSLFFAIDPITPSTLYEGTYDNGLFRSSDSGNSWNRISSYGSASSLSIAINPQNPSIVYVSNTYEGIYKTTDRGTNWQFIFNHGGIKTLAISPRKPHIIYAGDYCYYNGGSISRAIDDG